MHSSSGMAAAVPEVRFTAIGTLVQSTVSSMEQAKDLPNGPLVPTFNFNQDHSSTIESQQDCKHVQVRILCACLRTDEVLRSPWSSG